MQDKLYAWKYTGHVLVVFYLWAAFCLPWFPAALTYYSSVKEQSGKAAESPAYPDFLLPEGLISTGKGGYAEKQKKQCAASFSCRIVNYHTILLFDRTLDDPVALFTVILAVSTIGLWFQTWILAKGGEAQTHDIKAQIAATKAMAIAASRSADAAERATTKIERPYVYISPVDDFMAVRNGELKFTCANFGRTPALILHVYAKLATGERAPKIPFDFSLSSYWLSHTPLSPTTKPAEYRFAVPTSDVGLAESTFEGGNNDWQMLTGIPEGSKMYFMVEAVYSDSEGGIHVTSDCWVYVEKNTIFFRVDSADCHSMT